MLIGRAVAKRSDAACTVAVPAVIRCAGSVPSVGECERAAFAFAGALHSLPAAGVAERRVAVGGRGQDERHAAGELIEHAAAEIARVTVDDLCSAGCALLSRLRQVLGGEGRPPGLQLHTDRAAILVYGLDQRRRDSAHWVEHQVAGLAVRCDRTACDLGQHLRWMPVGLGQVTPVALPLACPLRAGPYRERQPAIPAHSPARGARARRTRGRCCAATRMR